MARRLRLQYEGAIYHVINRGNYRRDVFESVATARAFEDTLAEACERYGWHLYAYVVMRNHYHLALGTPQANLVEGMHWLQSTFATRFNRFRSERGHLFQGRYQALLVEDAAALGRVVNYIHLNPVRAKIVPAEQVATFRWSSLRRFLNGSPPSWLVAKHWMEALGLDETPLAWKEYVRQLIALSGDQAEQKNRGFGEMSQGWAIGTDGWRKAVAKNHGHLALSLGMTGKEIHEIKAARWDEVLTTAMREAGKTSEDLAGDLKAAPWKIAIAQRLRREAGAPCRWIAEKLHMGRVSSLRVYLCRRTDN